MTERSTDQMTATLPEGIRHGSTGRRDKRNRSGRKRCHLLGALRPYPNATRPVFVRRQRADRRRRMTLAIRRGVEFLDLATPGVDS